MTWAMGEDESRLIDRRMGLAREWDELVARVRAIDGFEEFLRPPSLPTLLEAVINGPVVIVNVSRWRCDALIVTTTGVRTIALPELSATEASGRTRDYLAALQGTEPAPELTFAERLAARTAERRSRTETMAETMRWLWDVVAEPVLAELGFTGPPAPGHATPRVWWCPTGLLTLLPLHGAGHHDAGDGRTVLDRVVSSYTPTLRALREAVRARPTAPAAMLFVGAPDTPDLIHMGLEVAREKAALAAAFARGFTAIEGPDATIASVGTGMARHRWVHVSCHGHQNLNDPSQAGLVLTDGTLTIPRISAGRYSGEFAFLSACMTATGGLNLPDEAITLTAALSYTGYRHVIGTLWRVHPAIAAEVTEAVYPRMTIDGEFRPDLAAIALHHAVQALRAGGARMDDWLPFMHTGP